MPDMLVKLYGLPDAAPTLKVLKDKGIIIRRVIPPEKHIVLKWISETFDDGWASEADVAIGNKPSTCFVAIDSEQNKMVGFGCYEATYKAFFGPTGVDPTYRGQGIGGALLLACLAGLAELGYAYAIIGGAGPVEFYRKTVGAIEIEDSVPGIYGGLLNNQEG